MDGFILHSGIDSGVMVVAAVLYKIFLLLVVVPECFFLCVCALPIYGVRECKLTDLWCTLMYLFERCNNTVCVHLCYSCQVSW